MQNKFYEKLIFLMDKFAHDVYKVTRDFPKNEVYGLTSQLRRAALSVVLNCIEGYSRQRKNVMINFLEISYGSLKESKYLISFAVGEKYLSVKDYKELLKLSEEIGAMLWTLLKNLKK